MAFQLIEPLTKQNIYNRIDSIDIFRKYCKNFEQQGRFFKSEFRDEKKGSCRVDWIGGDWLYKDFGGEGYRPMAYVERKFGLDYLGALAKINDDFSLGLAGGDCSQSGIVHVIVNREHKEKEQAVIKIKKRAWNDDDDAYWGGYHISRKTLDLFTVVPITHFSINNRQFVADKLAYSLEYYWDTSDHFARRIYQPFNKHGLKWMGTGINVVQGESMLPYQNHLLIITKSLKDVMVYYEMGINSVSPPSETSFLSDSYFNKQKTRFERVVLQFDNDETGVKKSLEFGEKYGLKSIFMPSDDGKDVSDVVKNMGWDYAVNLINSLIL